MCKNQHFLEPLQILESSHFETAKSAVGISKIKKDLSTNDKGEMTYKAVKEDT